MKIKNYLINHVLVCGTRDWDWYTVFEKALTNVLAEIQYLHPAPKSSFLLVHGGARGVDTMAEKYAQIKKIKSVIFNAKWNDLMVERKIVKVDDRGHEYNKLAGIVRNEEMLTFIRNKEVRYAVAFRSAEATNRGTANMIDLCVGERIPTYVFTVKNGVELFLRTYNFESKLMKVYCQQTY